MFSNIKLDMIYSGTNLLRFDMLFWITDALQNQFSLCFFAGPV